MNSFSSCVCIQLTKCLPTKLYFSFKAGRWIIISFQSGEWKSVPTCMCLKAGKPLMTLRFLFLPCDQLNKPASQCTGEGAGGRSLSVMNLASFSVNHRKQIGPASLHTGRDISASHHQYSASRCLIPFVSFIHLPTAYISLFVKPKVSHFLCPLSQNAHLVFSL